MIPQRTHRQPQKRLAVALGAVLLLASCNFFVPSPPAAESGRPPAVNLPDGWPAPALPSAHEPRPLPAPSAPEGGLAPRISRLADDAERVELAVLVIAATANDPALDAWRATLEQAGTPHEVLVATQTDLTPGFLVGADGNGRFSAVVLTTGSLVYQADDGTWPSAFSSDEWALLFQYESEFGVRQLALYAHPGLLSTDTSGNVLPAYPEDYGVRARDWGTGTPTTALLTAAGAEAFSDLAPDARIPVRNTWTYASYALPDSTAVPLLVDAVGDVLAAVHVAPDGRERLILTFDQSQFLLHSQLLGHSLLRWVTRGTFIGERRLHFDADVDDWFVPTDHWIVGDVGSPPYTWDDFWRQVRTDGFQLSANDAWSFALQQDWLRGQHPQARDFTWTMAFNGIGAEPSATSSCDPATATLSAMTKCVAQDYRWVNHTWSHAYMDSNPPYYDISYDRIREEVDQNDAIVDAFAFGGQFAARSIVTGDISGLGWYAPLGPDTGPKVDYGLAASNPDLLRAVVDTSRRYLASNMSTKSHEPTCASCGIVHPLNTGVFLVPRWPTNVYAAVATPEAVVQSYNMVYAPGGIAPYYTVPVTYAQFLDFETDIALYHVLIGSPYPHYFHVANLYEYAAGRSLLTDFARALFDKVDDFVVLPLISRSWDDIGAYVEQRTEHANAGATGVWDRAAGTITLRAASGGTVFFTGGRLLGGDFVEYGPDFISWREFAAGETTIVSAPVVPLPQVIDFAELAPRTIDATPFDVTATASSDLLVTFTADGVCSVGATTLTDGTSTATVTLTGTGGCTLTASQPGNTTYAPAPDVDRTLEVTDAPAVTSVTIDQGTTLTLTTGSSTTLTATVTTIGGATSTVTWNSSNAAVATIDGTGLVTTLTGGATTLTATSTFDSTITATLELTVDHVAQSITFDALPNRTTTDPPFDVTATSSSGLTVALQASGVCTVERTTVTLTGALGTCTITASQAGNDTYAAAGDVSNSFTVTLVLQAIAFAPLANQPTSSPPFTVSATATSGLPIAFSASPTSVCGVGATTLAAGVSSATVTLTGTGGTCTVTADQPGDGTYYAPAAPVAQAFAVTGPTVTLLPLRVALLGTGDGHVVSSPAGIDCGVDCEEGFTSRTRVSLTATAAPGSTFAGWGGACSGTSACTIRITQATEVTATFVAQAPQHTLAVTRIGAGTVKSVPSGINCGTTCTAPFAEGTRITLTASNSKRAPFLGWSGAVCEATTAPNCTFTIVGDTSVTARFGP